MLFYTRIQAPLVETIKDMALSGQTLERAFGRNRRYSIIRKAPLQHRREMAAFERLTKKTKKRLKKLQRKKRRKEIPKSRIRHLRRNYSKFAEEWKLATNPMYAWRKDMERYGGEYSVPNPLVKKLKPKKKFGRMRR